MYMYVIIHKMYTSKITTYNTCTCTCNYKPHFMKLITHREILVLLHQLLSVGVITPSP